MIMKKIGLGIWILSLSLFFWFASVFFAKSNVVYFLKLLKWGFLLAGVAIILATLMMAFVEFVKLKKKKQS